MVVFGAVVYAACIVPAAASRQQSSISISSKQSNATMTAGLRLGLLGGPDSRNLG